MLRRFLRLSWLVVPLLGGCGAAEPELRPEPKVPAAARPKKLRARTPRPELDPTQIVFSLRGREDEFAACAGQGRARGVVQVGWRVTASGSVRRARILESTLPDPNVAECVRAKVEELRFGRAQRSTTAHWTFVFGLEREAAEGESRRATRRRRRAASRTRAPEPGVAIEPSSPGFLEPNAIESVIQSGFRLYAHCYRDGIARNPRLGGALRLKLVIDTDGGVERVVDRGSDLPDQRVIDCVAQGLFALGFPKPEGGEAHVLYRIVFDPS